MARGRGHLDFGAWYIFSPTLHIQGEAARALCHLATSFRGGHQVRPGSQGATVALRGDAVVFWVMGVVTICLFRMIFLERNKRFWPMNLPWEWFPIQSGFDGIKKWSLIIRFYIIEVWRVDGRICCLFGLICEFISRCKRHCCIPVFLWAPWKNPCVCPHLWGLLMLNKLLWVVSCASFLIWHPIFQVETAIVLLMEEIPNKHLRCITTLSILG